MFHSLLFHGARPGFCITGFGRPGRSLVSLLVVGCLSCAVSPAVVANTNSYAAPADFNCDGRADISRKLHNGFWVVDFSGGDLKAPRDLVHPGYGDATAIPVPADYDGDCRADLSVKGADGVWYIDFAGNGFGRWDAILPGYGPASSVPVPADYDGDGRADLSVKSHDEFWYIDFAANGFGRWDLVDALGPPVPPVITLVARTSHSLQVRVVASGGSPDGESAASQMQIRLKGMSGTERTVTGDSGVVGFGATFPGPSLQPATEYCIEATAINSEGTTTRTVCFKTAAPGSAGTPEQAVVTLYIEPFAPGSDYKHLRITGSGFRAGEAVSLKITIKEGSNNPFTDIRQTTADSTGRIDYKYSGSGGGVCFIGQPRTFQVQATGLTSNKSATATAGC